MFHQAITCSKLSLSHHCLKLRCRYFAQMILRWDSGGYKCSSTPTTVQIQPPSPPLRFLPHNPITDLNRSNGQNLHHPHQLLSQVVHFPNSLPLVHLRVRFHGFSATLTWLCLPSSRTSDASSAAPRASKPAELWFESDYGSNVHDVIRFMILFSGVWFSSMVFLDDDDDDDDDEL
ncbi:hypothetical protein Q3G72_028116 [Acer saccharum]|nr:hypothetical protein Q3G72_028116 [Acer saccharum]